MILRLYAEHGEGCVKRLNGMFAFLLYDRERGTVLAARDHFGIKPLYYAAIAATSSASPRRSRRCCAIPTWSAPRTPRRCTTT